MWSQLYTLHSKRVSKSVCNSPDDASRLLHGADFHYMLTTVWFYSAAVYKSAMDLQAKRPQRQLTTMPILQTRDAAAVGGGAKVNPNQAADQIGNLHIMHAVDSIFQRAHCKYACREIYVYLFFAIKCHIQIQQQETEHGNTTSKHS